MDEVSIAEGNGCIEGDPFGHLDQKTKYISTKKTVKKCKPKKM